MFLNQLNRCINFILYSNIFIAIAAVCFTFQTELVFSIPLHIKPYHAVIFFSTIAEYCMHRMVSIQNSKKSFELKQAQNWSAKRIKAQYILMGIALIAAFIFSFYLRFAVFLLFASVALITLGYTLPLFSKKGELFRLRDLPFVKILFVSVVWAMVTVFPPLLYEDVISFSQPDVWIVFIQRVFFVFAITVPFDIRDAEEDAEAGVLTLPVLYGKHKTMILSYISIFFFVAMQLLLIAMNKKITAADIAIFISGLTTLFFLWSKKIKTFKHYYYGVLDGTIMLQFLLIWFTVSCFD